MVGHSFQRICHHPKKSVEHSNSKLGATIMLANKFRGSLTRSMHVYNEDLQSLLVDSHAGLMNMNQIVYDFMEYTDLSQRTRSQQRESNDLSAELPSLKYILSLALDWEFSPLLYDVAIKLAFPPSRPQSDFPVRSGTSFANPREAYPVCSGGNPPCVLSNLVYTIQCRLACLLGKAAIRGFLEVGCGCDECQGDMVWDLEASKERLRSTPSLVFRMRSLFKSVFRYLTIAEASTRRIDRLVDRIVD